MVCFEFLSINKLIFQSQDLKFKLINLSENSSFILENIREEKTERILALDEDKIALVYLDNIEIYCISTNSLLFSLSNKHIFNYDPYSDYLYLGNTGSLQILIMAKDHFIAQKYQESLGYYTLMEASNEIIIRKINDKPQILARHGEDVFFYSFKTETTEEPSLEIKEESPAKPNKKPKKFGQDPIKFETKQINPKEIISPIVLALNKGFDEIIRKIDKTITPSNINNLVTKTIQTTFDQKIEGSAQKNLAQSTVSSALRYEFQTSLIPVIQQQLSENFNKISVLFEESLKNTADYNNKSAAKAISLDVHMKNAIENIANSTLKIEKEYASQLKKITESEGKLIENFDSRKQEDIIIQKVSDSKIDALKLDIDIKLRNHEFEAAFVTVLKEKKPDLLFSVLDVINPKAFCNSRVLSESITKQLFYELIENIENDNEFKDIFIWVEELGKAMNIPANEVSRLIIRLLDLNERKPKMREVIKIFTMRLA